MRECAAWLIRGALRLAERRGRRQYGPVPSLDLDWRVRPAAIDALARLRAAGGGLAHLRDHEEGFAFDGKRVPLMNSRRGIWRPSLLDEDAPALSLVTTPPKAGEDPPYDDQVGSEDVWLAYKYERRDPDL